MTDRSEFQPIPETGLVPLCDLEGGRFLGRTGGLYPGGNRLPASHDHAGRAAAAAIEPLDGEGRPSPQGLIVFLAIGMSNTGLYFGALADRLLGQPDLHPRIRLVNAALEGKDITSVTDPADAYWHLVDMRLRQAGVTPRQVQAIWFMQARHGSGLDVAQGPAHIDWLCEAYLLAMRLLTARFPALRQVFSSGREYGGYNPPGQGNPEPYAYYSGWAWKKLVERQINEDLDAKEVPLPWLGWSGYFWADGRRPRRDGLCWLPEDFEADGVHPSANGRAKAAHVLYEFFRQSPLAGWLWPRGHAPQDESRSLV
jgi:hypothetical protein